ncbi:MAG: cell division protein FtsL [Thermodesulfobacteriota bacterium]
MNKKKKASIKFFHFFAILVSLFLLAGISHVWVSFKRTQIGYSLSHIKKEIEQIDEYNRKLTLEIASLKSPKHLENKAEEEFGLRYPLSQQIVFLP